MALEEQAVGAIQTEDQINALAETMLAGPLKHLWED